MDAVIAYVNGCEKVWRTNYNKYGSDILQYMNFYDWGTLKYVLRGISTSYEENKNSNSDYQENKKQNNFQMNLLSIPQ